MPKATLYTGDAKDTLASLTAESVQTCVTSPPYWGLRNYGEDGQIGLEETLEEYVQKLVDVFREVQRVLRDDGTVWLNLGDSYMKSRTNRQDNIVGGLKEKDLCMIPSRVAMALQTDGWWVRSRIVWNKPSCMPENVEDRPTSSHEYIFLLAKSKRYYYDHDAIKEDLAESSKERYDYSFGGEKNEKLKETGEDQTAVVGEREAPDGKNKRDVWTVNPKTFPKAHFAVYPAELIEPCVKAGSAEGDTVLDPFSGAGTTGIVALAKKRNYVGVDISRDYNEMSAKRIKSDAPLLNTATIK